MLEEIFEALEAAEAHVELAREWLHDVLVSEPVAYDINSGSTVSEEGVSSWRELLVLTDTQLLTWYVSDVEGEDLPAGSSTETLSRTVPLRHVLEVSVRTAYGPDSKPRGIGARAILKSQDYASQVDEEHTHIYHDAISLSKTLESDGEAGVARGVEFVKTMVRLTAKR